MVWSPRAEQVVAGLIAGLPAVERDPRHSHSVRLNALPIGLDMWSEYYLRPNGEVVVVGADWDHPDADTVHAEPSTLLCTLVWGSQRYPALRGLLPARPPDAVDCPCRQHPAFVEGRLLHPECGSLGWLPPPDTEGGTDPDRHGLG